MNEHRPDFTILMPCLNERNTLPLCIKEAQAFLLRTNIDAEILIADNGSSDDSGLLAQQLGARVIYIEEKGYGNALRGGIDAAKGRYIIIGDCDCSYDFSKLDAFTDALQNGYDFVIGNRFTDSMEKHAMPFLHQYLGIPFLSALGRLRFHTDIHDFHCGLRGFSAVSVRNLSLHCTGMEFATELIAAYADGNYRILQIPISFRQDKRKGASHLRTFSDGFRHLFYILFRKPPYSR